MVTRLVLFSGLPGTGKSVLAERLAREMKWPLFCIDEIADCMPAFMDRGTTSFWDQAISSLLRMVEVELKLGVSVIADSIFMNLDRFHARAIAQETGARFLPVHTFLSDDRIWEQRVTDRFNGADPASGVASWRQVQTQRQYFRPWEQGTALFLDGVDPVDRNFIVLSSFVNEQDPQLTPLPRLDYTAGKYHG